VATNERHHLAELLCFCRSVRFGGRLFIGSLSPEEIKGRSLKMKFLFFLLLFLPTLCQASFASISPSMRIYPDGGTLEAEYGEEWPWWDEKNDKEFWRYGFYQLRMNAAVHGATELSFSAYPISFVRLTLGVGGVYRFYNTENFNCTTNICQGFLSKNRLGVQFALAFGDDGEYFLIPSYNMVFVSHPQTNRRIVDETELILAAAGGDTLDNVSIFMGKQIRRGTIMGVYIKQSQYRQALTRNEAQYFVTRFDWQDTSLNFAIGRYASDFHVPGLGVSASYEWKWGKSLSFF
jgi:hypothetical protein